MGYSVNEIAAKFRNVAKECTITDTQFDYLCFMLQKVPKVVVDKLTSVQFVALGREENTACIVGTHHFKDKSAVVFLTHSALDGRVDNFAILHEIAHFELEHHRLEDREEAADKLVEDWLGRESE